jgi:hypothetical protein
MRIGPSIVLLTVLPALPAFASTKRASRRKDLKMKAATLTMEWDGLADPTDDDILAMFGQKAVTTVDGLPELEWQSADKAWDWLRKWNFAPTFTSEYRRLAVRGFVRPITIHFIQA